MGLIVCEASPSLVFYFFMVPIYNLQILTVSRHSDHVSLKCGDLCYLCMFSSLKISVLLILRQQSAIIDRYSVSEFFLLLMFCWLDCFFFSKMFLTVIVLPGKKHDLTFICRITANRQDGYIFQWQHSSDSTNFFLSPATCNPHKNDKLLQLHVGLM